MISAIKLYLQDLEVFHVRNQSLATGKRVISVDALRGFDMFWIMGGDLFFRSLDSVLNNKLSAFLKLQMDHVEWFGFHFYDIIMPLFLFMVGVSMVYSYRKRLAGISSDKLLWRHTIKRVLILWILGMMVQGNLLSYDINHIKFYTNTLQAIAAGYLIASVFLLYLPVIYQIAATLALMLSYWVIIALVPVPGSDGIYTPEGNVAIFIERSVMGKFIGWGHYTWIVSSINFGATVMLGAFAGYMMQAGTDRYKKFFNYIIFGSVLIILSLIMDIWHPIIKKIWTSSFVLFSGGICVLMLAVFYLIIDVWGITKGTRWMIILGSNAIFGYVAWHLFEKPLIGMARVFLDGLTPVIDGWIEPLGYLGGFLILYLVMWYMYKNRTFIKV